MDVLNTVQLDEAAFSRLVPSSAQALIVAECHEDTSDIMTDYHGSRTVATVVIGWSRHQRDLFAEMRQAAATFPQTAHLGPGRDIYTAQVVCEVDIFDGASRAYWAGSGSHWHRECYPDGGDPPQFETRADVDAFVASAPAPEPIHFQGQDAPATFRWEVRKASVEHREKWSMGHGYYLAGRGGKYSGWQVRKVGLHYARGGSALVSSALLAPAAPRAADVLRPRTVDAPTMTENPAKGGIELRFPQRPAPEVLDTLKAHGWRWSRFAACWYHKDSADARAVAARVIGMATVAA